MSWLEVGFYLSVYVAVFCTMYGLVCLALRLIKGDSDAD